MCTFLSNVVEVVGLRALVIVNVPYKWGSTMSYRLYS